MGSEDSSRTYCQELCWLCEGCGSAEALVKPCLCPRAAHPSCLAQWRCHSRNSRESMCRFCGECLPDWGASSRPKAKANAPVLSYMDVAFNGQVHQLPVQPGPAGYASFAEEVKRVFGIGSDLDINFAYECIDPTSGSLLALQGSEAFDAALYWGALASGAPTRALEANLKRGLGGAEAGSPQDPPCSPGTPGTPVQTPFRTPDQVPGHLRDTATSRPRGLGVRGGVRKGVQGGSAEGAGRGGVRGPGRGGSDGPNQGPGEAGALEGPPTPMAVGRISHGLWRILFGDMSPQEKDYKLGSPEGHQIFQRILQRIDVLQAQPRPHHELQEIQHIKQRIM